MFGAEPGGAYNRILLTAVLAGELDDSACISHDLAWYRDRGIALRAGCPIREIDRAARQRDRCRRHVHRATTGWCSRSARSRSA